jgi:hypothetical protein
MWEREIWRGLAVFDRDFDEVANSGQESPQQKGGGAHEGPENTAAKGFEVDLPKDDDDQDDFYEDEMLLAAFEAMDASEAFKHGEKQNTQHAMIPTDNFLTLIMFLLLIAPLTAQESVSDYSSMLDDDMIQDLRQQAHSILTSFGVEKNPGISYRIFRTVLVETLPHLLDPLTKLFEHFFYTSDFDLSKKRRDSTSSIPPAEPTSPYVSNQVATRKPLLRSAQGDILTISLLSHLSFILSPSTLFHNLTPLYSGDQAGFSMPTFQTSVFGWQSPTLLLVSGTLVSDDSHSSTTRAFVSSLPYRRLKPSVSPNQRIIYGAYIPVPWKQTHKSSFGTKDTVLFQISPQNDVFRASNHGTSFAYYNRYPSTYTGLGFGSPLADQNHSTPGIGSNLRRRSSVLEGDKIPLGPVSLHIDDSLTYAVFTHDSRGGGTFTPSRLPASCRLSPYSTASSHTSKPSLTSPVVSPPLSPSFPLKSPSTSGAPALPLSDWQDVFEIESLEVYGLGGEDVLEAQKRAREWEEREAERRRGVNLRSGDAESDRELLKMAGLIGQSQSGGSMG